jgi:protein-disulfide isomerase
LTRARHRGYLPVRFLSKFRDRCARDSAAPFAFATTPFDPMMRISSLAGWALLITATAATSACGQTRQGGGATAAAASGVNADSVLARADRGRMKGADSAQVTIIEISDFQCPYCREFAATTYRQIDSAYVRTGRARMLYINLPLSSHHQAYGAAEAAMCAGAQGKFWPMHDRLFAAQRDWANRTDAAQTFERLAGEAQLDMAAWRDCTANDRTAPIIVADAMQAAEARITGTPTFIVNGRGGQRSLSGAIPFDQFAREVDAVLAGTPAPQTVPAPQVQPAPTQP